MKCPICGATTFERNDLLICSRFPICSFCTQKNEEIENNNYILFDLETTGFGKDKARITEIGALKVQNGVIIDTYSTFVNPGVDAAGNQIFISSSVTAITGITNDMVKDAPLENQVIFDFLEWCGDYTCFAGHNIIRFDIPILKSAAKRAGCKFNPLFALDTLEISKRVLNLSNNKQTDIAQYYGFTYEAHRAVNDAEACYKILQFLQETACKKGICISASSLLKKD